MILSSDDTELAKLLKVAFDSGLYTVSWMPQVAWTIDWTVARVGIDGSVIGLGPQGEKGRQRLHVTGLAPLHRWTAGRLELLVWAETGLSSLLCIG